MTIPYSSYHQCSVYSYVGKYFYHCQHTLHVTKLHSLLCECAACQLSTVHYADTAT